MIWISRQFLGLTYSSLYKKRTALIVTSAISASLVMLLILNFVNSTILYDFYQSKKINDIRIGPNHTRHNAGVNSFNFVSNAAQAAYASNAAHTCTPTKFVRCDEDDDPHVTSNEQFGISMLRRPQSMRFPNLFDRRSTLSVFDLSECQYTNCYFQDTNINESTSLVIIFLNGLDDNFMPVKRWPHQLYAAYTWETPYYANAQLLNDGNSLWNSRFNLTATYRTDSDIFAPYGDLHFQNTPIETRPNYYDIAMNKTKSVAWFATNCQPPSKREIYVKQMQKIIDVDIFGQCGKPCPTDDPMCSPDIAVQYKFYLAFENSFCKDYITEKFFKLYSQNTYIVPVVRGGFDYHKYLPRNTFINAADFNSATDLALYLKQLGDDPVAYSKYLENKDLYEYRKGYNLGCQACIFLNTKKREGQIHDLRHWMVDNICTSPTDI